MQRANKTGILLVAAALLGIWGCESGSGAPDVSSSMEESAVKGTVSFKGKPYTKGKIVFSPANVKRREAPVREAKIEDDGTYSLTTLIGENTVYVQGPGAPPRNNREVKVKSGGDTIDIDLGSGEDVKKQSAPR